MARRAVSRGQAPGHVWIESLSPWPEEFGLGRMRKLLAELGDPQLTFPAIHVVGTNGKSTATRTIAALLASEGLLSGAYTSPHVGGWSERIQLGGEDADFERSVARIRAAAERVAATQFEALTAAALVEFAEVGVDVAVVEAGLGGRLDATNVLGARVVLLTNVALEHTEVLGDTRKAIAREKLAVAGPGAIVVLGEGEWRDLVPANDVRLGGAREAAEAFLGRTVTGEVEVALPGRLERRGEDVWDGAHNADAVAWLLERLPGRDYALCVSILQDKAVDDMLRGLTPAGRIFVATSSSNPRALAAAQLASRAAPFFDQVEAVEDPAEALNRAHSFSKPVLVTGSLYLLADLAVRQKDVPWKNLVRG